MEYPAIGFKIEEDLFSYKGIDYIFRDIEHIYFKLGKYVQKMTFMTVGDYDNVYLTFILASGKKIKLSANEKHFLSPIGFNKKKEIRNITEIYSILSEKTLLQRVKPYLQQYEKFGYYKFDGCLFYPDKKTISYKNKDFSTTEMKFLRYPGYITLQKKQEGLLDKIKREFVSVPSFQTLTDGDVILSLLKVHFNINWGK